MRTSLFLFLFSFLSLDATSQTLHAIFVSDVEDPKLGGISLKDEEKILQILKTAEWGTGLKLETYYHNRASFTASAIRDRLKSMRVQPRDVVFFYYTGLGYYPDANTQFPAFKLKENTLQRLTGSKPPLSLDEVGNILQQKGARLNVVMADCRDTIEDLGIRLQKPILDEDVRQVFLKKMFLGSCGLIKIASAKKGQPVLATELGGSVYTANFSRTFKILLNDNFDGARKAVWPRFLERTKSQNFFRKDYAPLDETPVIEINACTPSQHRLTTPYASYEHAITAGKIEEMLKNYKDNGGDYEKLDDRIRKAFHPNAKIELIIKNKYPASDSRAIWLTEQMSIGEYLAHFKKDADQVKYIGTDLSSVKRNPNYEYITSLTFIEIYDEL
jgi:hypothetical protein